MATASRNIFTPSRKRCSAWERDRFTPRCQRLLSRDWVTAEWGSTETGRKARIYRLTAAGRRRLSVETASFTRMIHAIRLVLGEV